MEKSGFIERGSQGQRRREEKREKEQVGEGSRGKGRGAVDREEGGGGRGCQPKLSHRAKGPYPDGSGCSAVFRSPSQALTPLSGPLSPDNNSLTKLASSFLTRVNKLTPQGRQHAILLALIDLLLPSFESSFDETFFFTILT